MQDETSLDDSRWYLAENTLSQKVPGGLRDSKSIRPKKFRRQKEHGSNIPKDRQGN